ncbi:AMP-binding protein [Altererythrobacter sp. Z27]|uniref:AMP-binding protein n=1 Tax=Altererythrobacter sp. Z27 TaxID=3461147 RepID=UPI004044F7EE
MGEHELIDFEKHSENIALLCGADGEALSYAKLDRLSRRRLEDFGTARKLIFLEASNSIESMIDYVAALRGGHVIHLMEACDAPQAARLIDSYRPNLIVSKGSVTSLHSDALDLHPDLAVLLSTSGSTGSPKFVKLSSAAIHANARSICEYLAITERDRPVCHLPLFYSFGMSIVNSHLSSGATLVLTDRSFIEPEFWHILRDHRVTSFSGVPHNFEILRLQGFDPAEYPDLRYAAQAGGRLAPDDVSHFARSFAACGKQFFVMYGQTEAAPRMSYLPPHLACDNPGSIGLAIPGGELALAMDDGTFSTTYGETGQLAYRGPNVMMGYAYSEAELAIDETPEWLLTGDIARIAPGGLFEIVGRASRFVKPLGLRIDLDEVESFVREYAPVAAVTGDDKGIVVAVEAEDAGADALAQRIATFCQQQYGLPNAAVTGVSYASLPRLANGKPDYRRILAAADEQDADQEPAGGARSLVGVALDRLFQRHHPSATLEEEIGLILGREIDPARSIMEAGADSLNYIDVSLAIESRIGELPKDWEALPIRDIEELASNPRTDKREVRAQTSPDFLLRAIAITGVVTTHAIFPALEGGAYLLLALAGTFFARFQHTKLLDQRFAAVLTPLLKILFAYYLILVLFQLTRGNVEFLHWVLLANFSPRLQAEFSLLPYYWFISAFVQITLFYTALFLIPAYRRASANNPWATGLATLGLSFVVALAAKLLVAHLGIGEALAEGHFETRTPIFLFYIFALGWCANFADTVQRKAALSCLAVIMLPFIGQASLAIWLVFGMLGAMWLPPLHFPKLVRNLTTAVASASFYIFIVHMIPVQILRLLNDPPMIYGVAAILASLGLGIALGRFAATPSAIWRALRSR